MKAIESPPDNRNDHGNPADAELDCPITVFEGSWMTCDMAPEPEDDDR